PAIYPLFSGGFGWCPGVLLLRRWSCFGVVLDPASFEMLKHGCYCSRWWRFCVLLIDLFVLFTSMSFPAVDVNRGVFRQL
ncbi:hypothetical protein A2U01_0070084, partial [Trifolium medium]|nr:hypothetical protein [Trifolium medium]